MKLCFVVGTRYWVLLSSINVSFCMLRKLLKVRTKQTFTSADPPIHQKDEFCIGTEWGERWIFFPIQFGGKWRSTPFPGTHDLFLGSSLLMMMPIDRVGFQLAWKYQESVLWVSMGTMNQLSLKMHPGLPTLHAECTRLCPYTESPSLKSSIMFAFFRPSQRH